MLSFNPLLTKVILVGTSQYDDKFFSPIPSVLQNIKDLSKVFADPKIIGVAESNILKLINKNHDEIIEIIDSILDDVNLDAVFIYYVGHGHREGIDKLYLTTKNTKVKIPGATEIQFETLKHFLDNSPIQKKIFIIDACFSGIAALSSDASNMLTDEENSIKGTFILCSSPFNKQSYFNEKYTIFTEELIKGFTKGIEVEQESFTLLDFYSFLKQNLKRRNYPEPQKKDNLNVSSFYIAKNLKYSKEQLEIEGTRQFEAKNYADALNIYNRLLEQYKDTKYEQIIKLCEKELGALDNTLHSNNGKTYN